MSDALVRMTAFLLMSEPWKPESLPGPAKRIIVSQPARPVRTQPAAIKRRIITALEKGPATGEEIAILTRCNLHSVHAKLSRMHGEGIVKRSKSAVSSHNGRAVQVYELK
jgi:predicted Rossmann fold nucleotide-binding protein DprA/Smf involved in DNA uptake